MDYASRRARIADSIGEDAILVLVAPSEKQRSNDTYYRYRTSSDLLYTTGFDEPEAVAVIAPGHSECPFALFVRPKDKEREIWDGFRHGPTGAVDQFGADAAWPIEELDEQMPELLRGRDQLYYAIGSEPAFDQRMLGWIEGLRSSRRSPNRAPKSIVDPRPLLHTMRMHKDQAELEVMRVAAQISAEAHLLAMKATRPGRSEFELQGIIESHFVMRGGTAPAYTSIVAGGANACVLHYTSNRDTLRDGDVLLVDAGVEYLGYAGDITRSWPVGAAFTPAQRDLYQAVLDVQENAVANVRAGATNRGMQADAKRALAQVAVDFGLLEGELDGLVESKAIDKYYMHGLGHYLGLDVHDVGTYFVDDDVGYAYEPGLVVTIEPGFYVPADDPDAPEELRGVGIRIEDDVVVTDGDPEVMTSYVPKSVAAIEELRAAAMDGER